MYKLRDYQKEAVDIILANFKKRSKPFVIQASVGAGKSIIIADVCYKLNEPVLILQPSKELLEQNYSKLKSYGIEDISMYSASVGVKEISKYTYATIGSIKNKIDDFKHFKYVIIDECHIASGYGSVLRNFLSKIGDPLVCGLTATPYRIEQKYHKIGAMLECTATLRMINRIPPFFFKSIAYKIETKELIDRGYLAPIKYWSTTIDTSDLVVNSTGKDFTVVSIEKYADKVLNRTVEIIAKLNENESFNIPYKKMLVFVSSKTRAKRAVELLHEIGINAEYVTSDTPLKERTRIIDEYKNGNNINILLNVGVLTTGFDVPEIDCIVLARPTMSVSLYYQMLGRGVRIDNNNPNKVLNVYDLSNTVRSFGGIEHIRLGKEDGYKDILNGGVGRLDDKPLYTFRIDVSKK